MGQHGLGSITTPSLSNFMPCLLGFVKLTGFTPNLGELSMATLRNFNGLASWRNAENSLQSVNLTAPGSPLDYGPVLLRKPFRFHLAMDTLPSGCLSTVKQLSSSLGCLRRFQLRARLGFRLSTHPGQ